MMNETQNADETSAIPKSQYRRHLQWGEMDPHRRKNTPLGMWAWLWQRISALLIVVLLALHITLPYKQVIQLFLLLVVTFHATLGLRVILLDFNLVSMRYHRQLAWGLLGGGLVVMFFVWRYIY
jgi:succinate dehydrogenase/fumarate reductase cytochrome b subunit